MNIFLDIGHPAHVHYFRHFIKQMEARGHLFYITARDREPVFHLLRAFDIPFVSRGKGAENRLGKIIYLIKTVWQQYRRARHFKPDLFIDFSTIYSGPAARILNKPYITYTDTEHTTTYRRLIKPFCTAVYTPQCFRINLGHNHFRFNGLLELASLQSFKPDENFFSMAGLKQGEPFSVIRFVEWNALHDKGKHGFSDESKIKLVQRLQTYGKIFLSAEGRVPASLEPLRLKLPPEKLHQLLYHASIVVSEGATTACEAALLGTPVVYLSELVPGYLTYLEQKYALLFIFGTSLPRQKAAIDHCEKLALNGEIKKKNREQAVLFKSNHLDMTWFMMEVAERWTDK